jgi:hypothetical protein
MEDIVILVNLIQRIGHKPELNVARVISQVIMALEPDAYSNPFQLFDRWVITHGQRSVAYGATLYIDGQQWTIERDLP